MTVVSVNLIERRTILRHIALAEAALTDLRTKLMAEHAISLAAHGDLSIATRSIAAMTEMAERRAAAGFGPPADLAGEAQPARVAGVGVKI